MSAAPVRALRLPRPGMGANALALMISSAVTGLLGLVYWGLAERYFPTETVGRASAAVTTATMLGTLACLSLGGSYERFLGESGRRTRRYIVLGLALVAALALLLGTAFVALGLADRLVEDPAQRWAFPGIVLAFALYALVDPICIGLGGATWAAAKNICTAVVKLAPVVLLSGSGALALSGSWALVALTAAAVTAGGALRSRTVRLREAAPTLPPARELLAFQGASFTLMIVATAVPLVLPLVVLTSLGATQNAYFNLAWSLCAAVGTLYAAVMSSYVATAANDPRQVAAHTRRVVRLLVLTGLAGGVGLAGAGPVMLHLVSPAYAEAATPLLRLMAVSFALQSVVFLYGAMSRVVRRQRLVVAVQTASAAGIVGGVLWALPQHGLTGVGLVHVAVEAVCALVVAVPCVRLYRSLVRGGRPPAPPPAAAPAAAPAAGPGDAAAARAEEPSVGVVVPLYRVERYVEATIAAIAAQTVRPAEVVLVDDRGGDRSAEVALAAARAAGLPVRLLTHPRNLGLSAARNSGLRALSTDLVWFCDSDDTADPRFIELLRAALTEHGADLAAARTALTDRAGNRLGIVEPPSVAADSGGPPGAAVCTGPEYARRMLVNEARGYACNKLLRRSLFDGLEFPVGLAYEDLPVLLRLSLCAGSVALVDEPLYHYTSNEASISRRFGSHTLDLFRQDALVREELVRAGLFAGDQAPRWRAAYTRYRYDGVVLPVANMALRARSTARSEARARSAALTGVPRRTPQPSEVPCPQAEIGAAVAAARRTVRARELARLWRSGARRPAIAGAVLGLSPRVYAAVLERR